MPIYCYTTADGQTFERVYPASRYPQRIRVKGKTARLDIAAAHRSHRATPGNWPLLSDAMGVLPSQIGEAMALDRQLGVKADYDSEGRVRFESPGHRKRYLEAHGCFDRDGGYGDPRRGVEQRS